MIDTPFLPPQVPKNLQQGSTQAQLPVASTVSDVPPGLRQVPVQSLVNALVLVGNNQAPIPAAAPVTVQTAQGNLSLNTTISLREGSSLVLRVLDNGDQFHAKLETINNRPAPQFPVRPIVPYRDGQPLTVNILREAPPAISIASTTARASVTIPASSSQTEVEDTVAPETQQLAASGGKQQAVPLQAILVSPLKGGIAALLPRFPPAITQPVTAASLTAGSGVTLKLTPPGATPPTYALTGTVVGTERSGDVVVQTPMGSLKFIPPTPLQQGQSVSVEVLAFQPAALAAVEVQQTMDTPRRGDAVSQLFRQWSSLDEITKLVTQSGDEHLQKAFSQAIPTIGKQLPAQTVSFLSTVRSGNVSAWLGDEVTKHIQQAGREDLLHALTHDVSSIRQLFVQTSQQPHGWQTLLFPIWDGTALHQARMFIRDDQNQKKQNDKRDRKSRFIVEVEVESLGELQFDGLVHGAADARTFELIIRSHQPLPGDMKADIIGIFTNVMETGGTKGALSFQETDTFPVNPEEEALGQGGSIFV